MDISRLLQGELIGKVVTLIRNKDKKEIKVKIVDETKFTVVVKTDVGDKRLIKAMYAFEFQVEDRRVIIDGKRFLKRPEERIKTKLMRRW
jgi:ribonuclease P protein subunit POP4